MQPQSMATGISSILLIIVVLAVISFIVFLLLRKRPAPASEGVCGKCGYAVRGLTTFNCPECGSDLREVGIVPAQVGGSKVLTITAIVIGLVVLLCAGLFFAGPMSTDAPPTVVTPIPAAPSGSTSPD